MASTGLPGNVNRPLVRRALLSTLSMVALLAGAISWSAGAALASPDPQQPCRILGEFQVCGRFLEEWSKYGGDQDATYVNGLPITPQRPEISLTDGKLYDTQWFERARYELHPENKAPYDLLLGRLGASLVEGRGEVDPYTGKLRDPADRPFAGIAKPADADGKNKIWFQETGHSVSGKILDYWTRYGGLQQFGFPLSEPFQEVSEVDGKTYSVQYFERNRLELHPENPGPYAVELGLLGVQQYRLTPVPGDQLPIAPPVGVKSTRDTLVIGIAAEPGSLDIGSDTTAYGQELMAPTQSVLVDTDEKGNRFPMFAWYVPTVENGGARFVGTGDDRHLQIKYKLRPGMKWSDGVEITSRDAVFDYKSAMDPDGPQPVVQTKLYNIDNPDKYTVLANFMSYAQARDLYNSTTDKDHFYYLKEFVDQKRPVIDYDYTGAAGITPEHVLANVPRGKWIEQGYFTDPNLLVTAGPYKLERWDKGQQIAFVPNPYYTLTAPPILKRIVYRIITDRDTRMAQLKSGDVDVLLSPTFPAPDDKLKELERAGFTIVNVPGPFWEQLTFNLDQPYFRERTVRQAIAYAINRQETSDQISGGTWPILHTLIPPVSWASEQNPSFPQQWKDQFPLHVYDYDPAMANQMLDQAGWVRGPDGIRAKGGVKLSFRFDTTDVPQRALSQSLIQADLRAVGIDARVSRAASGDFFNAIDTRDFDLAEYAWIFNGDAAGGGDLYDSAAIPTLENGFAGSNQGGYRNPHYDELSRAIVGELDRSKQYPMLAELQSIYSNDLPSLPLFERTKIQAHKPNLVNWEPSFSWSALVRAQTLYFK